MDSIGYQSRTLRVGRPAMFGIAGVVAILLAAGVWWVGQRLNVIADPLTVIDGTFMPVVRGDIDVFVRKDGELQSVKHIDLLSGVEGMNTIRSIVPEGTFVKTGDVVAEIDSSEIKRKVQGALLDVKKSENDFTAAKQQRIIQDSKNTADLEAANVELRLAKIDLRSYNEGEYPQKLAEAQRNLEMAKITLRKQEQNLAQTRNLLDRGYVTSTDMEKAQLDLVTAQNDFEKKTTELRVLTDYTHEKEEADKLNKVAQAEKKVARTESENASNLAQKIADEQTKEQSLLIQKIALEHWQLELDSCTLHAPADGMVVYGSSVSSMFYRESPIQAGAKIMEQQLLARLPDTSAMKVVARIAEANASKLRIDAKNSMRATVKIQSSGEVVPATVTAVSVLPDNTMRWLNPDLKEYPVDVTLDRTPGGLKPGGSASVEILVQHLDDVLTAPLGAIYSLGADQYAFVRDGSRVKPVKLTLGATNDTVAQIAAGLAAGDEVLVLQLGQGQKLLEAAGISTKSAGTKSSTPATQPAAVSSEGRVAAAPSAP
ncbi:hypothetical protein BH09PLA1_BH09PLA1_18920 [soil metagenome]